MKHEQTITNKIVKNINNALEAIPRALNMEKEKPVRKSKSSGTRARKSGITARARRAGGRAKKSVSAMGARSRRSSAAKLPKRGRRKSGARSSVRGRSSGRRSPRTMTMARAA